MKKHMFLVLGIGGVLLMCTCFSPVIAHSDVNVSIQVPLPPLVIPVPPGLVVIPESYVYYPPDVDADIFFYHGYWYRPHHGRWYRARHYNGPWRFIVIDRVPRTVIGVPPGFRHAPRHGYAPYRDVRKNWRGWERDRHWDRGKHKGAHKKWEPKQHRSERKGIHRERRDFHKDKHRGPEKRDEHKGKEKREKRDR